MAKKYLDQTGLNYFWSKIKLLLNTKANTADLSTVATSGSFTDLSNKPTIPTKTSQLTNDSGYLTAHQDISGKVDKVSGKGLSTNDYTTAEKNKLSGIANGATAVTETTVSDWGFTKYNGTYSDMIVGNATEANQLGKENVVISSDTFMYRPSIKNSSNITDDSGNVFVRDNIDAKAEIKAIYGNTLVWNQLVDEDTASVTLLDNHVYLTRISGIDSRTVGDGSAIEVSAGDTVHDLTMMFGAGREPATAADFRALFPRTDYAYDAGSFLNFIGTGIKTVGFNALSHDGTARLLGGCTYEIVGNYTGLSYSTGQTIAPVSGVFTPSDYGTLTVSGYDSTTCVHLKWSGYRDGEYEPYWTDTKALPISTYFPYGMNSMGNVHDELTRDKAITRVRYCKLSDLNWRLGSGDSYGTNPYFVTESTRKYNTIINVKCSYYTLYSTAGNVSLKGFGNNAPDRSYGAGVTSGRIYIRDDRYSSVNGFISAMGDVDIYYELNESVEISIDPPLDLSFRSSDYGTEEVLSDANTSPIIADICYVQNMRDKLQSLPIKPDAVGDYYVHYDGVNQRYNRLDSAIKTVIDDYGGAMISEAIDAVLDESKSMSERISRDEYNYYNSLNNTIYKRYITSAGVIAPVQEYRMIAIPVWNNKTYRIRCAKTSIKRAGTYPSIPSTSTTIHSVVQTVGASSDDLIINSGTDSFLLIQLFGDADTDKDIQNYLDVLQITEVSAKDTVLEAKTSLIDNNGIKTIDTHWVRGSLSLIGEEQTNTWRLISDYIDTTDIDTGFVYNIPSGYRMYCLWFSDRNPASFIGSEGWSTGKGMYIVGGFGTGENDSYYYPARYCRLIVGRERESSTFPPINLDDIKNFGLGYYPISTANNRNGVKGIAHRGYLLSHPENTMPAFKEAVRRGFRAIETDIQFTADGVPVIMHDYAGVARTTDGEGKVYELNYNYIQGLDAGSWKSAEFTGTPVPKFEDVLKFVKQTGIELYAEIIRVGVTNDQALELAQMAESYGVLDKITWCCYTMGQLTKISQTYPNCNFGYILESTSLSTLETELARIAALKTTNNKCYGVFNKNYNVSGLPNVCKTLGIGMIACPMTSYSQTVGVDTYVSEYITNGLRTETATYYDAMVFAQATDEV